MKRHHLRFSPPGCQLRADVGARHAEVGAHHGVPLHPDPTIRTVLEQFGRSVSGSLASVIRLFKQAVTRHVAPRDTRAHHGVPLQHDRRPDAGARHGIPAQHDRRPDVGARHGVPARIWQRNYYEHIIRDQDELEKIREYIRTNPLRWACDRHNPARGVLVQDESGRVFPWES